MYSDQIVVLSASQCCVHI